MSSLPAPHRLTTAWSPPPSLLKVAAGDEDLIPELIDAFSTDTAVRVSRTLEALSVSDFAAIRAQAHTIRGSALEVGAGAVASTCQQLELACEPAEVARIALLLERLQSLLDEVRRAMSAYCDSRGPDIQPEPLD